MIKRLGAFVLDFLQVIVFAVAIFLFVYLLILQPHKIKGDSMVPSFLNGDFLLTDKVTYRFNEPKRGDVIVFKAPPDDRDEFIKRIVGLPGEEIVILDGIIYVNGKALGENYIPTGTKTNAGSFASNGKRLIVPENSYFVLGDNRPHSFDSRAVGFIAKDKITGRAWFLYWPIDKLGTIEKVRYSLQN